MHDSMLGQVMVLSLAVWKISSLLYGENGPWGIMRKLRSLFGIIHDDEGEPVGFPRILSWMDCFWCVCLFVALLISAIWCIMRTDVRETNVLMEWFVIWMATSAGSVIAEWQLGRGMSRLFK